MINSKPTLILIDSRSNCAFLGCKMAERCNITLIKTSTLRVLVTNGQTMRRHFNTLELNWKIQRY